MVKTKLKSKVGKKIKNNYSKSKIDKLPIEQVVYVPSTKQGDKKIPKKEFNGRVLEVRKYLSQRFGGHTSIKGVGGYYHPDKKKMVKEDVVKVTSFATKKKYKKYTPALKKQLGKWGRQWGQHSMGYEHEGDLYYYPRTKRKMKNPIKKKVLKSKIMKKMKKTRRKKR